MNDEITTVLAEESEFPAHGSLIDLITQYWNDFIDFIVYIFYGVLLGKSA